MHFGTQRGEWVGRGREKHLNALKNISKETWCIISIKTIYVNVCQSLNTKY